MAVTLTYDPVLSRVRITATAVGDSPDAIVERSTDLITWTTVRGGSSVDVTAGSLALPLDDYEFAPDVLNTYRVRTLGAIPELIDVGSPSHGTAPTTNTPVLPVVPVAGDIIAVFAGCSTGGASEPVDLAPPYSTILDLGSAKVMARIAAGGDGNPTVSYSGATGGDSVSAVAAVFRGATLTGTAALLPPGGTQTALPYPPLTPTGVRRLAIMAGWKWDDWSSVSTIADMEQVSALVRVTGHDMGMVWDWREISAPDAIPSGAWTTTGAATELTSSGGALLEPASVTSQTSSITPMLTEPFLKSINRPFLNMPLNVCQIGRITRASRSTHAEVIDRVLPVVQSSVRGSRSFPVTLATRSEAEAHGQDALLTSGDLLYLQMPAADRHPSMYVDVGTSGLDRYHSLCTAPGVWVLPMTEAAAPAAGVVGSTATWQTVIDTYATWADVIIAQADWASVLDMVASPDEVVP